MSKLLRTAERFAGRKAPPSTLSTAMSAPIYPERQYYQAIDWAADRRRSFYRDAADGAKRKVSMGLVDLAGCRLPRTGDFIQDEMFGPKRSVDAIRKIGFGISVTAGAVSKVAGYVIEKLPNVVESPAGQMAVGAVEMGMISVQVVSESAKAIIGAQIVERDWSDLARPLVDVETESGIEI